MTTMFKNATIRKVVYDEVHHDVYMLGIFQVLCFSEKLGQFTGTYDYYNMELMESYHNSVFAFEERFDSQAFLTRGRLWTMFEGVGHLNFFNDHVNKWSVTFICNGIGNNLTVADKTYTNLEFRASVEDDGTLDEETGKFTPALPLDTIEVWNEYQHGIATLENKSGHSFFEHFRDDGTASLKRKFRIWRCDIPRNNAPLDSDKSLPNCYRKIRKPLDRMRNPWLYIKLTGGDSMRGTELHDIQVTYFV